MIPKKTIDEIFDAADIVEVIGGFVNLKKSGSNYKGLSPFVNEKTPSFMVSASKRIFKDFSSGKGGNVVSFLMEHEHFSYPEALKWLAKKYNITIEEKEQTPESIAEANERESLYIINNYAKKFFSNELNNTQEGKSIGLSYFKHRGFIEKTINTFELGYSPDNSKAFSSSALKDGYKEDVIVKSGLVKKGDNGIYDFFRGRIIFPIHNLTGRVIAFGGRILNNNKKTAKYFNSPESEIYNKSKVLYGLYFAKNEIGKKDNCYLVEGYTDVIALHQNEIKNVVSSSGTSLTEGQIRLIKRFSKNITILYDGDSAGIKASFRGIDLILKEGLNVNVVLFPDGEDPDSYSNKVSNSEFLAFLENNKKDFIQFKAEILLSEANNDPIILANTIKEIVKSISCIDDEITRTVYVQETSQRFDISEKALNNEVNKLLRSQYLKHNKVDYLPETQEKFSTEAQVEKDKFHNLKTQEKDIIRLLLLYGTMEIELELEDESLVKYPVAQFVVEEIMSDDIQYNNNDYQFIFNEFYEGIQNGLLVNYQHFSQSPKENINKLVVNLTQEKDAVSENWQKKHNIFPKTEASVLKKAIVESVSIFKLRVTENLITEKQEILKNTKVQKQEISILKDIDSLNKVRNLFAKELGIIITQ